MAWVPYAYTLRLISRKPSCMVLPPMAEGSPIFRISFSFSFSKPICLRLRRISFPGLVSRKNAVRAGTILANRVAAAAPPAPSSKPTINRGSNTRFSRIPPRFRNMGRTVSPWAWWMAENRFTINKKGISQITTRRYTRLCL